MSDRSVRRYRQSAVLYQMRAGHLGFGTWTEGQTRGEERPPSSARTPPNNATNQTREGRSISGCVKVALSSQWTKPQSTRDQGHDVGVGWSPHPPNSPREKWRTTREENTIIKQKRARVREMKCATTTTANSRSEWVQFAHFCVRANYTPWWADTRSHRHAHAHNGHASWGLVVGGRGPVLEESSTLRASSLRNALNDRRIGRQV